MNIDFTGEELAQIIKLIEASSATDRVTNSVYNKASRALANFKPEGYDGDPQAAAQQWKSPI